MANSSTSPSVSSDVTSASRHESWRLLKDRIARHGVAIGGVGVIGAIVLIFFYLLYVVFPLFVPASTHRVADYAAPGGEPGATLLLGTDELGSMGTRITTEGRLLYFSTETGKVEQTVDLLPEPRPGAVHSAIPLTAAGEQVALGLTDGRVLSIRQGFKITYPNDVRTVNPFIEYPLGQGPLVVDPAGQPLARVAMRDSEKRVTIAALTADGRVVVKGFDRQVSLLTDEATLEPALDQVLATEQRPDFILLDPEQTTLYVAARNGQLQRYTLVNDGFRLAETVQLLQKGELTALRFLLGGYSLLAGTSNGTVQQWMPVRDAENRTALQHVRDFSHQKAPINDIAAESRRKGFFAADAQGRIGIYHTTAHRKLLVEQVSVQPISRLAIAPRGDAMLVQDAAGQVHFLRVENEHPEVSWSALWGRVQYEGYSEPQFLWQSSGSNTDFEPKFSLTPLAFGTFKAALFAMLVAVPISILGAIYTGYFMAPAMRQLVKPTVEIMGALPTVILGFLAGLWLAPYIEQHLPGVFALVLLMPMGVLLFAWVWHQLPLRYRTLVPEGWEALLLVPVLVTIAWISLELSLPVEELLFGGDMRNWLDRELGITYDQRNAMVVGIAMGFAVIPNIFSITEDAIFSVPKQLTFGSLALGATTWQTLSRVVILTASPGIFSAVMIGMGRAVGETMIVLMATGNTPVMDMSLFNGMRTLSANIAVEMPESEVGSTHYRVLFLAALVLFMFTFAVNTLAEVIRQRLRRKYSNL